MGACALLKVQVVLSSHHSMSSWATGRAGVGVGLASVGGSLKGKSLRLSVSRRKKLHC